VYFITQNPMDVPTGVLAQLGLKIQHALRAFTANDRKSIDVMQNTFLFNTKLSMSQQYSDMQKYEDLIRTDDEIIALRESVKKTSFVQLENGVINTNDYLKEVNEEDQARQNKILHDLQLLMIQYAQKTTSGN